MSRCGSWRDGMSSGLHVSRFDRRRRGAFALFDQDCDGSRDPWPFWWPEKPRKQSQPLHKGRDANATVSHRSESSHDRVHEGAVRDSILAETVFHRIVRGSHQGGGDRGGRRSNGDWRSRGCIRRTVAYLWHANRKL